jgi:two-component system, sensor histidine kinase and response regulator
MSSVDGQRTARIMVVDDDPDTVTILARSLEREGFRTIEAHSGAECLRLIAEKHAVDLILLDLMMPELDGFQVVEALKNNPDSAQIPIIVISARDDVDARSEGMRLGVNDFLTKPVLRKQLANRVRAQLEMLATLRANEATLNRISADIAKK